MSKIVKYSDYGTKYPFYTEANFQGSCSIKYTSENEYLIYRGELSQNHREGNGQYNLFAKELISSRHYYGSYYSWGDKQIKFYADEDISKPNRKSGNAKSWVEISQNHHMTLITNLL